MHKLKGLIVAGMLLAATAAPALAGPPEPRGEPPQGRPTPVVPGGAGEEEGRGRANEHRERPERPERPEAGRPDHADAVVEAAHTRVTLTNPDGQEITVPLRAAHAVRQGFGLSEDATERLEQLFEQLGVELSEEMLAAIEEMEAEAQPLPKIVRTIVQRVLLSLLEDREDGSRTGDADGGSQEETEAITD